MKVLFILLIAGITISSSCKKNINNNPVPLVATDFTININLPSYNALIGVGGWCYVAGGSKGIVVYRRSMNEFVAFDRHSPANSGLCADPLVIDTDNNLQLLDSCNNAVFSLVDGSPIANSTYGLRAYNTFFNGSDLLRIYN